jgi:hypothetical protein
MDMGIIKNLKHHYRNHLLRRQIAAIDKGEAFKMDLLDALKMMKRSWEAVTPTTICNCFGKAGFVKENVQTQYGQFHDGFEQEEDDTQYYWNSLKASENFDVPLEDYIDVDQDLATTGNLSTEDIIASFTSKNAEDSEQSADEAIFDEPEKPAVTRKDAQKSLDMLRLFMQQSNCDAAEPYINKLDDMFMKLRVTQQKQKMITDFLHT